MAVMLMLQFRRRPDAINGRSILTKAQEAKRRLLPSESAGLPGIEKYIVELKAIDTSGAPADVRDALRVYVAALEHNAEVRRNHGDTNGAAEGWIKAEVNFARSASHSPSTAF